jgi:hypothetical protein
MARHDAWLVWDVADIGGLTAEHIGFEAHRVAGHSLPVRHAVASRSVYRLATRCAWRPSLSNRCGCALCGHARRAGEWAPRRPGDTASVGR